jgi:hypothetical protein
MEKRKMTECEKDIRVINLRRDYPEDGTFRLIFKRKVITCNEKD